MSSPEQATSQYERPDGTPKATGRELFESVAVVRVDDNVARSGFTIHVEHPEHDGGVRCFFRTDREMVVSGVTSHLRRLSDEIARVEVIDEAGLGLTESELTPRTWLGAASTPEVTIA